MRLNENAETIIGFIMLITILVILSSNIPYPGNTFLLFSNDLQKYSYDTKALTIFVCYHRIGSTYKYIKCSDY